MKSKRLTGIVLMVIITISLAFPMNQVNGAPETQNIYIVDTINDGFVTESGILWTDNPLVHVTDPNMDIRSFVVFRDLEINRWEILNNATLRFYTPGLFDADLDSKITIYGVKQNNFLGFETASQVISAPLSDNFVIYNTSAFTGSQMHEIDVTEIVRELIGTVTWTGDGHSGTDDKDNLGFIMYGASGHDLRWFQDFGVGNNLGPRLTIKWGDDPPEPTPPAGDPPLPPGEPEINETYRDFIIWELDHNEPNRTGSELDVNWNNLNMSELTELDSGVALTLNNDTWVTVSALQAQQINTFYNDTGGLGINSFFARFAVNISSVTNNLGVGSDQVMTLASLSTSTPVGGGGLWEGGAGDFVGLVMMLNADDQQYLLRLQDRSGAAKAFAPANSGWFQEADNRILYIEFYYKTGGGPTDWCSARIYWDDQFSNAQSYSWHFLGQASPPFRYAQVCSSLDFGLSRVNDAEFYTFSNFVLPENTTWIVTYPNGTIVVQGLDDYEDAIAYIEEILGDDPQDPDPPGQQWDQTGPFTRFKTRLYIFLFGVCMIWGPVMFFAYRRPSGYNFVVGLFIMLIGLGLLIHAGSV